MVLKSVGPTETELPFFNWHSLRRPRNTLKLLLLLYNPPTCPPIAFQNRLRGRAPSERKGLWFPHPEYLTRLFLLTRVITLLTKAILLLLKDQARTTFHPSTVLEDRDVFHHPTYLTVALAPRLGEML